MVLHILKLLADIRLANYGLVFHGKLLYDSTTCFDLDNSNVVAVLHKWIFMRNEATPVFYQTVRIFERSKMRTTPLYNNPVSPM
jgi:hypothetical protein